ncbi:unnamed protein product [Ceratitis capitata]|uniref:(Mediterranean fruit fly) hypothetical protein n=1 Tax=Ceratitis capitata TaxID=7213 RepID=A0A811UP98_CERCA|nr:unnamed protein product [Ceratitis capitata]
MNHPTNQPTNQSTIEPAMMTLPMWIILIILMMALMTPPTNKLITFTNTNIDNAIKTTKTITTTTPYKQQIGDIWICFTLQWSKPTHSSENIVHYELYWNDTYANQDHHKRISNTESYTLDGLYPDTLYYIWLAARSQRGEGATTPPIPVRTKQYVPGAPPRNITAMATSPTTISVSWLPPPVERANGRIIYYKVFFVEVGRADSEATIMTLNKTHIVLDELKRWTEYKIWTLAGTSVGDGPRSHPIIVRTHEDAKKNTLTNFSLQLNFYRHFSVSMAR